MTKIIELDQQTANLIAAGEVIENVASVVKELVENSIDAEASNININLTDAGIAEVIVSDNGVGMGSVDAKLSLKPHATSKIKSGADLDKILTLGFRGEALPSIVAVSNFRLKTSEDGQRGVMLAVKGGELINEALVAHPRGTEISVKNLFFNTPARYKHMQSANTELSQIVYLVSKIALARPDIAFRLANNDKVLLQTFGTNKLREVVFNIYGNDVTRNMVEIFSKNSYFEVSGLVARPNINRSNRNHIHVLINGRAVKDQNIIQAVLMAYKERIVTGRYPIAVINVEIDPSLVDVNIHPGKLEVKIANETELLTMITDAITHTLSTATTITEIEKPKDDEEFALDEFTDEVHEEENNEESIELETKVIQKEPEAEYIQDDIFTEAPEEFIETHIKESQFTEASDEEVKIFHQEELNPVEKPEEVFTQTKSELRISFKSDERVNKLPPMEYIGQLHSTYLLFQDEENFYIVDQHAAYERINYEKIKKAFLSEETIHYELLVPIQLTVPSSEAILVSEKLEDLKNIGVVVEEFGQGSFLVREVPIWFTKGKEKEFVEDIIFAFVENKKVEKIEFFDKLAILLACKRSVKANEYLNKQHIEYLMEDLGRCEKPYSCPHGRPTIIKFTTSEIERWFKRIV